MTREIRTGFCEIPFTRLEHITCRLFTGRRLIENLSLIGFHNTKRNDGKNTGKAVHFYMDDYKFECVWNQPERYLRKLSQYRFVLTPDFSLYTNMPLAMQIWNVFRGQWCGAFWQANGADPAGAGDLLQRAVSRNEGKGHPNPLSERQRGLDRWVKEEEARGRIRSISPIGWDILEDEETAEVNM